MLDAEQIRYYMEEACASLALALQRAGGLACRNSCCAVSPVHVRLSH